MTNQPAGETAAEKPVAFSADTSRGFSAWLAGQNASIAVTTYQAGKIIFFGTDTDGTLWVHNRNVGRCLGMASDSDGFWVSSDVQLYRFKNILEADQKDPSGVDALFAPRYSIFTGDLDIHDLAIAPDGTPIFANTLFNCFARSSLEASFEPIWKPSFISRLAAEDRCHLNGLALRDGEPAFATAVSQTDVYDGWRDRRRDGGILIDVNSNEIMTDGLSMPHSPRWKDGRIWLHNSGTGEFGSVDPSRGTFDPLTFCPGFLRGLDFIGDIAVVGLSLPRSNKTFDGLKLQEKLDAQGVSPRVGIYFIDTKSGDTVHSIILGGVVTELYDVTVLSGIRKPAALSPLSDDIKRTLSIGTSSG